LNPGESSVSKIEPVRQSFEYYYVVAGGVKGCRNIEETQARNYSWWEMEETRLIYLEVRRVSVGCRWVKP